MQTNGQRITKRVDYKIVLDIVEEGSRVLDLGCGDGELLNLLRAKKNVTGRGIDINIDNVVACLSKGLDVSLGDIDKGLPECRDGSYDYVVLNETIQVACNPQLVIKEMLRVGKRAIVSFPNFGNWKVRAYLFFKGRMPKSKELPYEWYETPNIHLTTVKDFRDFCKKSGGKVVKSIFIRHAKPFRALLPNIRAEEAVFVIEADNRK